MHVIQCVHHSIAGMDTPPGTLPKSQAGLDLISGKTRRILVGDFSLCGDSAELWINYAMADARFAILLIN